MKKVIFFLTLTVFSFISFSQTIERQVIGSTGQLTNTGEIRAFSNVGEPFILTISKSTLIVTQGFEQSDSFGTTGIKPMTISKLKVNAYPNPTTNQVILAFKGSQPIEVTIEIYSEIGQKLGNPIQTTLYNNCTQEVNFTEFTCANYIMLVKSKTGGFQTSFKIQKVN